MLLSFEHLQVWICHSFHGHPGPVTDTHILVKVIFLYIEPRLPMFHPVLAASHPIAMFLWEDVSIFLIPPHSSSGGCSQQRNLSLTSSLRLKKPRSPIHVFQLWPSWWLSTELTPVPQSLSCVRRPDLDPASLVWSYWCWAMGKDPCVALVLLCLCRCSPRCKGGFTPQVHCCLLRTGCLPGHFWRAASAQSVLACPAAGWVLSRDLENSMRFPSAYFSNLYKFL